MTHQLDPLQDKKGVLRLLFMSSRVMQCDKNVKEIRNREWNDAMKQGYKDERKGY